MPLGWKYANNAISGMTVFGDAVLAYRASIGKPSKKVSKATNEPSIYMGTFAYIGFHESFYDLIVSHCEDLGVVISDSTDLKRGNNMVWMNINITRGYVPTGIVVDESGTAQSGNLIDILSAAKCHVTGYIGLTITVKRTFVDATTITRTLGLSLKMMQVVGESDAVVPELDQIDTFVPNFKSKASSAFMSRLQASSSKPDAKASGISGDMKAIADEDEAK
ncbi:hypothetical protein DFJ73DRAFT_769736 [Zopfochytrium polystomum]|nr:hypothetical protein DFJ73DRAFT_769736 [Zopfochytrium polystomum]